MGDRVPGTKTTIRVLLVEDVQNDAELEVRELRRAGLRMEHQVVKTEKSFRAALAGFAPDVILSDFAMPGFDGMRALRMARELRPDTPFIFVSGTMGEENAIRALKNGATDYVLKTNLVRLPVAVERALQDARQGAERRRIETQLLQNESGLRRAQLMAGLSHVVTGPDGSFESWSESLPRLAGVPPAQMPASTRAWMDLLHPDDRALFRSTSIEAGKRGTRMELEYRLRRKDGALIHVRQVMEPLPGPADERSRTKWFNTLQDVTAQKQAAAALSASEERYRSTFEQAAVGIVHTSLDGQVLMVNQKFCEIAGYARAEAIQLHIRDLTYPEDLARSTEGRSQMLAGPGEPYQRELRLLRRDRSAIWVSVTTSLVRGADQTPLHFVAVLNDISERKLAEHELQRFGMAMDVSVDSIYLTDPATMRFVYLNDTACRRLGYTREQLLHMGPQDVLPMAREEISGEYDEVIAAGDKGLRHERRFVRSDGSEGWTELHRRALRTEDGTLIVTIGRDITERKQADDRIRRLNRVFAMLSGINAAIVRIRDRAALLQEVCRIVVESGRLALTYVCVVDPAEQQLTPVASAGADGGFLERIRNRMSLRDDAPEGLGPAARAVKERRAVVVNDVENDPRIRHKKEHRERGIHSVAILPLFVAGEPTGVLGLHSAETGFFDEEEMKLLIELAGDISFALDHIEKANRLDYLAYYDSLTGLANRTLFLERLNRYTDAAGPVGEKLALVVADIERLRTINESLGRQAGDALLKQLAERLARGTGRGQLARIGADIFVVVLLAVRGKSEVTRRIERIWHDCFSESFRLGESEVRISAKAGAAVFPNDGADAESLLTNAEAALRRAKTTGERHVFHALEMTEKTAEKLTLENRLRQALEKSEFVLHYQPKVDLETRRIVGVEALIRWQSPELGLVPPMKFIPLMEETGLILPVGSWALKRASHDHRSWVNQGLKAPRVAVNVSPIQLRQRDFVGAVEQAIIEGVAPTGIDLEITESLIMEDIQGNIEKLKAVRQLGVQIAIDDFGTGYSSLGYLAKLPVQLLKIDRSFIITMLNDPNHMTLVQTIISLAHSLKLKVVAEGVDSEEQAKLLRLLRCDEMQGYLFSKPVPFEQMTALLALGAKS